MAVAIGRRKKEVRTGLHMNFLFFLMSVVVLLVMGISMWKDTHPEWLAYQNRFVGIERGVLLAKRDSLLRQINNPNYVQDYEQAKKGFEAAKAKNDTASAALETHEADLEELDIRARGGNDEEGGGDAAPPKAAATGAAPAPAAKATKGEMDELDKEFASGGPAKSSTGTAKPTDAGSKPAPAAKPSDKELAELDKEFADNGKGKSAPAKQAPASKPAAKASSDEMAELDKEFADKAPAKGKSEPAKSSSSSKTAPKAGGAELDELDKEFKDVGKAKSSGAQGSKSAEPAPATASPAFEEADLQVDQAGARARLEAAERDLLTENRVHNKEMIGLPAEETLKRQLSDAHLKEATLALTVAQTGLALEDAKAVVKSAAQVARWAVDAKQLEDLTAKNQLKSEPADHVKQLQTSAASLKAHIEDLKRDLRLIEGRLSRNKASAPEVEQLYVDRLGAIDRCTTCHRAVEQTGFETTAEPFRTHSPEILKYHPTERFGCVSCHGGWGNALGKEEAHGGIIGKGRPLLVGDQIQSSCGKCHGETRQLSGEATYLAGAKLFKNSGCLGCHKVELNQPASNTGSTVKVVQQALPKAGPDLDRVGEKIQPEWLVGWLQNPQSHSLDARMPNLGLQRNQAMEIATYLLTQRGEVARSSKPESAALTQQRLAQGKKLVKNLGCLGCHTVRGEGASIGPELTNIRTKVNAEWLYGWIANPKTYFPNSRMPVLNLTREQCVNIGDYLLSVGTDKRAANDEMPNLSDRNASDKGSQLISERGCAGCHDMKGFDRISAPDLTHVGDKTADVLEFGNAKTVKHKLFDYILAKVTDPRSFDSDKFKGKMPKFGLEKEDASTIAVYLMSLSAQELPSEYTRDLQEQGSPLLAGRRIFAQHDCASCHRIAGQGGKIGPELTREGEMVRPGWLFEFLKNPIRIRWWQDARMPNYHLTDEEATKLTEFFMALSNQPAPYEYTPPDQKIFPLAQAGAKYFTDLKCQSCHPLAGKQGVAGGDTKKIGPDLGLVPSRLKKDWLLRFLKDPQAFSPGTQMPNFGKPDNQYSAIIDFLMKQRQSP